MAAHGATRSQTEYLRQYAKLVSKNKYESTNKIHKYSQTPIQHNPSIGGQKSWPQQDNVQQNQIVTILIHITYNIDRPL